MSVEERLEILESQQKEILSRLNEISVKADNTLTLIRPAIDKLEQL